MLILCLDLLFRVLSPPRGPCIYTHRCHLVQVELGKPIWIQSEWSLSFPCRTLFILVVCGGIHQNRGCMHTCLRVSRARCCDPPFIVAWMALPSNAGTTRPIDSAMPPRPISGRALVVPGLGHAGRPIWPSIVSTKLSSSSHRGFYRLLRRPNKDGQMGPILS